MTKRRKIIILTSIITLIILVGCCAIFGYNAYIYRFGTGVIAEATVKIYPGTSAKNFFTQLEEQKIIKSAVLVIDYSKQNYSSAVQPGNYKLEPGMSYRTLVRMVARGDQTPVRLTFNNVRTLEQLAGRISKYTMADSLDYLWAFRNDSLQQALGENYRTLPGIFLPNTYEIYWTMTPTEFVDKMKKEHDAFWNDQRKAKADSLGFTPLEITIIASIVSEETNAEAEMSDVAGVYINRLRKGMLLQADPTVKFAVGDFSIKRVLNRHLEKRSPYNTYKNPGLPPGPICMPAAKVIDQVLKYQNHKYYYFCANSDFSGTHAFAETLHEHGRNAAAYQRELNRRNIK